ncbi:ABC transporter permease [Saccharomonospora piscinae]|uniref:Transport permease protein n=1 Tax=Saccharomonospora piscinae TaxID=687388 RepID=W5VFJ1_SACPI|nr:ABC transporter permease [Saccharomonospora piscinae]AHH53500.1 ABC-type multidrug transport system [Saccharomonospora piscinae]
MRASPPPNRTRGGNGHPPRWPHATVAPQLWVLLLRQIRVIYADRRVAFFTLLQPLIMLMLFSQVFGRMVDTAVLPAGVRYIDYLVPALLVTTGVGASQGAGLGLVRDMESGMVARFRALPVNRVMVLVARSLADLTKVFMQLVVLTACCVLAMGFAPAGGFGNLGLSVLLTLLIVWALIWIFIALATWLRNIEMLSSIGFLVTFPLMFASSAFVPLHILPGWLQFIATINPVTYAVNASRALSLGWPDAGVLSLAALLAGGALIAGAMTIAVRKFAAPWGEG